MSKLSIATALAAILFLGSSDALACGATLFGSGQGSRFQAYRARVPANVLIYASPALAQSSATEGSRVPEGLRSAGHKVTVVGDADALAAALREQHYDVVIAGAGDAEAVAQQVDGSGPGTGILPVVSKSSGASSMVPDRFPESVKFNAGTGQFLRAINNLMAARAQ